MPPGRCRTVVGLLLSRQPPLLPATPTPATPSAALDQLLLRRLTCATRVLDPTPPQSLPDPQVHNNVILYSVYRNKSLLSYPLVPVPSTFSTTRLLRHFRIWRMLQVGM